MVDAALIVGPPSLAPVVRRTLVANFAVTQMTGERIYSAGWPSAGPAAPAVLVQFPVLRPVSEPEPNLWSATGQVSCVANTEGDADELSRLVVQALAVLQGAVHDEAHVIGVNQWNVQVAEDGRFAPPKPLRIVSVTLTARSRKDGQ